MNRRVDLVLSELHERDATSTHARLLRDILAADGHTVRFVVERTMVADEQVLLLDRWKADADLTVLQHSIGSLVASEIAKRRVPVVVNYHNITPLEFVEPWEPEQIEGLRWGRQQLWELRPLAHAAICDSDYNARELREVGYEDVSVSPVLFDGLERDGKSPPAFAGITLVFVGRLSPNKCQQDLVGVLAALDALGIDARLALLGGGSSDSYRDAVGAFAARLGVAERVVFGGSVSERELVGWYEAADVFVSTSEHEGFGVPLVEAMAFGVPVVAFGAAGVPETAGGAALVLADKSPAVVAEAIARVVDDSQVQASLIERGRARAAELSGPQAADRMRSVLEPLLAGAAR